MAQNTGIVYLSIAIDAAVIAYTLILAYMVITSLEYRVDTNLYRILMAWTKLERDRRADLAMMTSWMTTQDPPSGPSPDWNVVEILVSLTWRLDQPKDNTVQATATIRCILPASNVTLIAQIPWLIHIGQKAMILHTRAPGDILPHRHVRGLTPVPLWEEATMKGHTPRTTPSANASQSTEPPGETARPRPADQESHRGPRDEYTLRKTGDAEMKPGAAPPEDPKPPEQQRQD